MESIFLLFGVKFYAWLKLFLLKLLVWKFSILWPQRKTLPRVLIIKPDHLGDFLIALSSYQNLCDYYHERGYKITILVNTFNRPLAEACPLFDEVWGYNILHADFTFRKQYEMYCRLYAGRFSIVINPQYFPGACLKSHTMALLCRAPFCCTAFNYELVDKETTARGRYWKIERWRSQYSLFFEDRSQSVMATGHNFAKRICHTDFPMTLYSRGFGALPEVPLPENYYVVVPGAVSRSPWPVERFAGLIAMIHRRYPELIPVLTGGKNEKHLGAEIQRLLPEDIVVVDKIGDTTLFELFSIFQKARLVVSNDTGTAHVAPLMSVKSVVISGGWHIGAYLPNSLYPNMRCLIHRKECANCGWQKCVNPQNGVDLCVAEISVDEVMRAISELNP